MSQRDPKLVGGAYRVGQVITTGPMLTTCTAYNRNTNDVVGLLIIELPPMVDMQAAQRLLQPLERRRLVQSPHVIRVYDWGIEGNRAYIATDRLRGLTLRHVLDHENIDLQRALDLAKQMARGLKALHEQGIVGLDLRPQLITVDTIDVTDRVQLDDVGLRSLLNGLGYISSQSVDDIGYLDPRYAPPEYIQGGQVGPWSDIYQLGLLLFELVTGRLPFVGQNAAETGVLQSTSPVPRMVQYKHDAPESVQQVVDRALAKEPVGRFTNAEALLAALEGVQIPRRPSGVDWPAVGGAPPARSTPQGGLTGEMPPVDEDVTLRATLIGGGRAASPTGSMPVLPAKDGTYAYLCFEKEGGEVQQFALTKDSVVVGRTDPKRGTTPDIDLTALDPNMTVSRQHVRIRYEGSFFYIEDLKSRNKTRLGELILTPLKPELLQHGDVLQLGSVRLIFKVPGKRDIPKLKQ